MDRLLEFVTSHPLLVTATVLMFIALVVFEIRMRGRAALEVSIPEAIRMINKGAAVADVRPRQAFDAGHIVDAIHMSAQELGSAEKGRLKKKRGVLVVCQNGGESLAGATRLRAAGFDGAFSLKGGMATWVRENQPVVAERSRSA